MKSPSWRSVMSRRCLSLAWMSLPAIIIGVAIKRPEPVAHKASEMSAASTFGSTLSPPPMRPNAPIIEATVPSSPSSGPMRTIVEIDAIRFSIVAMTSVWNSITRTCLTFASPLSRTRRATAMSCARAECQ